MGLAQASRDAMGVISDVGTAIVGEESQHVCLWHSISVAESPFDGFDQHFAHWLPGQTFTFPRLPGDNLAIAAVFGKRGGDGFTRVTFDFKAIGIPAPIAVHHSDRTVMFSTGVYALRCVRSKNEVAAASWANMPEGQIAFRFAQSGNIKGLATCTLNASWKIDKCYRFPLPDEKGSTIGWRISR